MSLEEDSEATPAASVIPTIPNSNPIITINCGGQLFQTFRETLVNNSEYFRAMLAGGFAEGFAGGSGSGGRASPYFLDMNPQVFALLLDRMRYGMACKLPASGDQRPSALVFAAEFLGVEYRNEDEIELEKKVLQQQQAALQAAQKELDKQARLASLKEAGLVGFQCMCVDKLQRKCLAQVIDVDDTKNQYLIHYEHFPGTRYDEWVPKDSDWISRNIQRCDCRGASCPDSSHLRGGNIALTNRPAGTASYTATHAVAIGHAAGTRTATIETYY